MDYETQLPATTIRKPPLWQRPGVWAAACGLAVVLIVAGVLGSVATVNALGLGGAATFTVHGKLTLTDTGDNIGGQEGGCDTTGTGYSDIQDGASVTITGSNNQTVALGHITIYNSPTGSTCVFTFLVPGVPTGQKFYGIEISHRGAVQYTAQQIRQPIELSLGD